MKHISEFVPPFLRTAYNYDTNVVSDESGLVCKDPSLAVQADLIPSDINTILRNFGVTGKLPMTSRLPTYGDFTGIFDFQSAINAVNNAQDSFDELDADLRYRFHNDPQEFVAFCSDEANRLEAEKLGLVMPKAEIIQPINPVDKPV